MKLYDLVLRVAGHEFRWRGSHEAPAGRGKTAEVERWKAECPAHGVFMRMAAVPQSVLDIYGRKRYQGIVVVIDLPQGVMPELEAPCPKCAVAARLREEAAEVA